MSKFISWFQRKPFISGIILTLLAVIIVGSVGIGICKYRAYRAHGTQAVFLTNGQVYFGTIQRQSRNEVQLTNIYYLQTDKSAANTDQGQQGINLIKLGNELHGPEDRMYINRANILFIEDLKGDSKVVKAMQDYKK